MTHQTPTTKWRLPWQRLATPLCLQQSDTECGIAALTSLMTYFGTSVPLEELRTLCGTSRDGCKATTLLAVAKHFQFESTAYRVESADLFTLKQPVIAYWKFNHYLIIEKITATRVWINDPAIGRIVIPLSEFEMNFTGVILMITPTATTPRRRQANQLLPLIQRWLRAYTQEIGFLATTLFVLACIPLLQSAITRLFIDTLTLSGTTQALTALGTVSTGLSALLITSQRQQLWTAFKLCLTASFSSATILTTHLLRLPLLFYTLRSKTHLMLALAQTELVVNTLAKSLTQAATALFMLSACCVMMALIDSHLCIASLSLSFLLSILSWLLAHYSQAITTTTLHNQQRYQAYTINLLRQLETIKACGIETTWLQHWQQRLMQKLSHQQRRHCIDITQDSLLRGNEYISLLVLFVLGGIEIQHGRLSLGFLLGYYSLHGFFQMQLHRLWAACKEGQLAYLAQQRVQPLLDTPIDRRFQANQIASITDSHPSLYAENITFHYNQQTAATLHAIHFTFLPQHHIAIVGSTGSGKSTLAKILAGLYHPDHGELRIGNQNSRALSAMQWASVVAYVSQEPGLLPGTLRDNLMLGQTDIPATTLTTILQITCLTALVARRGLDTIITEQGNEFSQGEKQRIAIARALLQNTPILILDEATAALDKNTEAILLTNLRRRPQTIIFVAHRLSTIQHCDQILVMEKGQLLARGTHNELLQHHVLYQALVSAEEEG